MSMCQKLPFRSIIVASSDGKTVPYSKFSIECLYKLFCNSMMFSSSVHNDPTFTEVRKHIRDELHVDDEKEQLYFDNYNPTDLENVVERQKQLINYMKNRNCIQY